MKFTTTNGKEYYIIDYCQCCRMDTAGNHERGCPNNPRFKNWGEQKKKEIKEWKKRFDEDIEKRRKRLYSNIEHYENHTQRQ